MGTDLYGPAFNIFDPLFGATTDDGQTARQMATIALSTEPGSLDGFPEYGFVVDEQCNRALDATATGMVPLEAQQGLLAEPAFVDAAVTLTSLTETPGGGASMVLDIEVQGAEGDAVGFTASAGGG